MAQGTQRSAGMPLSDFLMQLEDYNPTVSVILIYYKIIIEFVLL